MGDEDKQFEASHQKLEKARKEGQVVNRLVEEYGKEHRQEITNEVILEKVAEASKNKVHIA